MLTKLEYHQALNKESNKLLDKHMPVGEAHMNFSTLCNLIKTGVVEMPRVWGIEIVIDSKLEEDVFIVFPEK